MQEFAGKTAIVTGGASGIGRAMAEKFAEARMNVVLADIEEDALKAAVTDMQGRQFQVMGTVTNTMRRESVAEAFEKAIAEYGNIHILCNNAGIAAGTGDKAIWEVPDQDWDWTMGVNFYGVLYGVQEAVPHMLAHGEPSHIVNTASLAGLMPGRGPYGVSKHAVLALTESLYRDLKDRNANVSASVLCPGFVNTNIHNAERNRPEGLKRAVSLDESRMQMMKSQLERGKTPKEVADIVFESIEKDSLYILPHPAWDELVLTRAETILARGGIMSWSPEEMEKRRANGDVF